MKKKKTEKKVNEGRRKERSHPNPLLLPTKERRITSFTRRLPPRKLLKSWKDYHLPMCYRLPPGILKSCRDYHLPMCCCLLITVNAGDYLRFKLFVTILPQQRRKLPRRADFNAIFQPVLVVPNPVVVYKVQPVKQCTQVPPEFVTSVALEKNQKNQEVANWRKEKMGEDCCGERISLLFSDQRRPLPTLK